MAPTTPLPAGTNKGAIGAPLLQGAQPTVSLSYGMDAPISGATPVIPLALAVWCSCISVFLLYSWFFATPPLLLRVPRTAWALMHALGTTLTSGVIVISAAIESLVIKAREPDVMRFWFDRVPKLDGAINLPALTVAMVSGVGIAAHKCERIQRKARAEIPDTRPISGLPHLPCPHARGIHSPPPTSPFPRSRSIQVRALLGGTEPRRGHRGASRRLRLLVRPQRSPHQTNVQTFWARVTQLHCALL